MNTYVIATAIIKSENKFLIAKRAATKKFAPNQWEFVSGFIDTSESAEEIILRELKEELNATGTILATAHSFEFNDEEGRWIVIPFLIQLGTQEAQVNPEDHSELKWVTVEELKSYPDLAPFLNNEGIQGFLDSK